MSSSKNITERFRKILSGRQSSFLLLLFCIISKSLLIGFYTYTGKDKIYSLSAGYNLLHGKGWTNSFYYLDNTSKETLAPFCYWPPGYGLLMTPFQTVFGTDLYTATLVLEITCFIVFLLLFRSILKLNQVPIHWVNTATLLLSFFPHDFIENSLGTDLPALDFILGFFLFSLKSWHAGDKKPSMLNGLLAGLCLFGAGFTRFIYTPVCLFIALVFWLLGTWKKDRVASVGALTCLLVATAGLVAEMVFQTSLCGSPFYSGVDKTGLFWKNLTYWHPAAIAAFANLNLLPVQLEKLTPISYASWLYIFSAVNLVAYLVLLVIFCNYFWKRKDAPAKDFPFFTATGFLYSASIIGGLALLSLTHDAKYTLFGNAWTFIVEGRYHAFPVVFLQLLFFILIGKQQVRLFLKGFSSRLFTLLAALMIATALHQVYYTVKVATNFRSMKSASIREQDYAWFQRFLEQTIQENPGKDILVLSSDRYYPLLASMHQQKGIADPYSINEKIPRVDKPSILITVSFEPEKNLYSNYLARKDVRLIKDINGARFYRQEIQPQ